MSYCMEPLLTLGRMVVELCRKGPDALPSLDILKAGLRATYEMLMPLLTPVMKVSRQRCRALLAQSVTLGVAARFFQADNSGMLTTLYEYFSKEEVRCGPCLQLVLGRACC